MLINEVSKATKLTKKAIEYYTLHNLVTPSVLASGYKDYSKEDVEVLNKISVLRKLDISIPQIRAILNDPSNVTLQNISVKKELDLALFAKKKAILEKLCDGKNFSQISLELETIEKNETITQRLLAAFPGYYGRFVCLHFSRFLDEPIETKEQAFAYETIISFLDSVSYMDIPKDLEEYLIDATKHINTEQINLMLEKTKKSIENPDEFLSDNKETLQQYLEYKQSQEFKSSPAFKLMELMKKFNSTNGYNDVFIPAMKVLSKSYSNYYSQMEIANEKLLANYPEIEKL